MKERKNDVYNHPQNMDEVNEEARLKNQDGNKAEQNLATNPNPRANENLHDKDISTNENSRASQVGSEITDGEDG